MTATQKIKIRADHVGSLLRPQMLKDARAKLLTQGRLARIGHTALPELESIEDESITEAVRMQEELGLAVVTDGEFRRAFWHFDFMDGLNGLDMEERDAAHTQGAFRLSVAPTIKAPLSFPGDHPMIEHFKYVASVTNKIPKISIPGPSSCHFRTAPEDVRPAQYQDAEVLFADIASTYKQAVHAFYEAGCRYLQLDDIFFAYLCDPKVREERQSQGTDPDELIKKYAWMMDEAIKDRHIS